MDDQSTSQDSYQASISSSRMLPPFTPVCWSDHHHKATDTGQPPQLPGIFPPSVLSADLHRQLNQHLGPWTLAEGAPPSPRAACSSIPVIQESTLSCTQHMHNSSCLWMPPACPATQTRRAKHGATERKDFQKHWSVGAGHLNLVCGLEKDICKNTEHAGRQLGNPSHWRGHLW